MKFYKRFPQKQSYPLKWDKQNKSMNCIIFVFATASLIVGCNSHAKKNATISTVKNDAIRARIDGPSAPPGGDYTIGDPESIKRFGQWSARDRALALIAADNGLYYSSNPMQPRTIPYVAASRANGGIPIKEYYQTYHPNPDDQRRFENLTKTITGGHCSESILIPTHPDTVSQHPVIQGILRKGHENIPKNTYPGLVAYNTMSRSMAVLNQDPQNGNLPLLFGLKVGSDKVANTHQPGKLSGVHWNARYVNALSDPTSVHALAEKYGIAIVSDSIGLVYGQDYGVVLRDYDSLLAEKDYFFIPLMAFQEKLIKRGSPTNGSGTYFWNIYKPGRSNVFDKNKSILRIVASREHVEKFIDELSEEMGKLIAIYYLNGVSSLDLHGQNLLVGIPLDPQRQAMLAVRDISDHWVFPYAPTGYIQLKYGPIPEPNWCRALYQGSAGIGSSCSRRSQDLTLMGFRKIAQGTGFDLGNEISPKTTSDIYNTLLGNPERYGPMIRKVRQMEIPPKVAGCLRSAGCPQARGLLTP